MPFQTFKTTVKIGDQDQEVEVTLPDGATAYTPTEVRETFIPKPEFGRRVEKIAGKKLDEALTDEAFKTKALQAWGINLGEDGKVVTGADLQQHLERARGEWRKTEVDPLKTENATLQQRVGKLLDSTLDSQILAAARTAGVKEQFLKPALPGQPALIVGALRNAFDFDEESNQFLAIDYSKNGEGYLLSSAPSADKMYKDVTEFVSEYVTENKGLLDEEALKQSGPKAKNGGAPPKLSPQQAIAEAEAKGDFVLAGQLKADQLTASRK